jgi:hypothetical protein
MPYSVTPTGGLIEREWDRSEHEGNLLASFGRQLAVARLFFPNVDSLGRTMAHSFVVSLRNELGARKGAVLPFVGCLTWNEVADSVSFESDESLVQDALERGLRLSDWIGEHDSLLSVDTATNAGFWFERTVQEAFSEGSRPYPGQEFLARLGSLFIRARIDRDPNLAETLTWLDNEDQLRTGFLGPLTHGLCLGIHDAICCGAGIDIETVGEFKFNRRQRLVRFSPGAGLIPSLRARKPRSSDDSLLDDRFEIYSLDE